MDLLRRLGLSVCLLLSLNAYAGRDPIGWSMSGSVPAITHLNQTYSVNFVLRNNLPFTMPTPLKISNNSTPASAVTMHDSCSGLRLAPNATCDVGLVLVPVQAGQQQLSIFMEYGKNKVQIPETPIKSQTQSGSTSALQGTVSNRLPSAIRSNSTYNLTFTFSNRGSAALTGFAFTLNPNNTAGYTQTSTSNCGATLPAGGPACVITGTFTTAATTGAVSVGYTATAGSLSAAATTSAVINNSTGSATRTFNFVNNCTQDIYFAMNGGGLGIAGCTTDAQCDAKTGIPGAFACGVTANGGAGGCFWKNPAPTSGNFQLAPSGTATVYLTEYTYTYTPPATPSNPNPGPVTAVWSGNVAGRTTCTSSTPGSCDTGYCGSTTTAANGNCAPGVGFQVPVSLMEMTLQPSGDSYDLSVINGINVPMSMTPGGGGITDPSNPYTCGSPGLTTNQGSGGTGTLGACPWTFTPTTTAPATQYNYVWVANGGTTPCTSNATCTAIDATYACGLSSANIAANTITTYCAKWLGYWTADQVCGNNSAYDKAPYFCTTGADGGSTFTQMYACAGSPTVYNNSCYSNGATSACCGCQNWQNAPTNLTVPSNSSVLQCQAANTTWGNNALSTVSWIKAGCPSSYVYPFDDKSSSFTCKNSSTANSMSYTITFCPGNHSGAPTGTTPA